MSAARNGIHANIATSFRFMSGASSLETLLKANPALPVVVLSAEESPDEMRAVLAAGALGFVPKRQPASVMLKAIELVLSGGAYVPMEALSLLGSRETQAASCAGADADGSARVPAPSAAAQAVRGPGPGTVSQIEPVTQVPSLQPHQQHLLENLSPRQQDIMADAPRIRTIKPGIKQEILIEAGVSKWPTMNCFTSAQ